MVAVSHLVRFHLFRSFAVVFYFSHYSFSLFGKAAIRFSSCVLCSKAMFMRVGFKL